MDVDEIDLAGADVAVVVGPTASGKSDLALALAEKTGGEIIGADSVQVYRYFDIGSGKPSKSDRQRVTHHLIDVADPSSPSMPRATRRARARLWPTCGAAASCPSFAGARFSGCGRFSTASPAPRPAIRSCGAATRAWRRNKGAARCTRVLLAVDPDAAARLDANDFVRVSRALEVFELTGRPLSRLQSEHGFREPRFQARLIGIGWTAEELVARIAQANRKAAFGRVRRGSRSA